MTTNEYGMTAERDPGRDYCMRCHGSWSEAYEREKDLRRQLTNATLLAEKYRDALKASNMGPVK